jgi:hypothetical protein
LWNPHLDWSQEFLDEKVVRPTLTRLSEVRGERIHNIRRRLGYETPGELLRQTLLEGDDFAVEFLAWYLEENVDRVRCESESATNKSEPDLKISLGNVPVCNVELKRCISTSNLANYAQSFVAKDWQTHDPRNPSVLLVVFPLLSTAQWRVEMLIDGYREFCSKLSEWDDASMYVFLLPAPIEVSEDHTDLPLRSVTRFVEQILPH